MAMTKAEKERMTELERALALSWPAFEEPKPMTLKEVKELQGYAFKPIPGWYFNAHSLRVTKGCTTAISHNTDGDTPKSRDFGTQYRTELDAARAMRWAVCRRFAKDLHEVDQIIERATPDDE